MTAEADYAMARDFLLALKAGGVRPGMERMRRLVAALGHPERAVPCVHVAGTNGKGSVAAMLESILRAAGKKVGLYTSPHLVRLGERVQVNREPLGDAELARLVAELRPVVERGAARGEERPSYFELMTALAFVRFARAGCDVAVIEAGMGGRGDATNVVDPEVAAITSIGMDHAEFLGGTIEAIAREKAGIVKPGRPVAIGRMPAEAEAEIRAAAAAGGSYCVAVREVYGAGREPYPETKLAGEHQRWNAATAVLAARLGPAAWGVTEEIVARGLREVAWPGRWQELRAGGRRVILEAAHNAEGAAALAAGLCELSRAGDVPHVVIGVLGPTRAKPLLEAASRHAKALHLVVPQQRRACPWEELAALVPAGFGGEVRRDDAARIFPGPDRCDVGAPGETVVVTGSIYLVGEVLARLEPARGRLESELQDF